MDARARAELRRSCSLDTLRERLTEPAEIVRSIRLDVPRAAARARPMRTSSAQSMSTMVTRDAIAPRTSINGRTGRHRRLSVVRVPLADVKEIRAALGGTVNDVVLAGVGGRAAPAARSTAATTTDGPAACACCARCRCGPTTQRGALGNKVSAMFVSLPVDDRPALERLAAISAQTADLKERRQAVGAEMLHRHDATTSRRR